MLSYKPTFSLSFTFIKRLFSSSLLSAIRGVVICIFESESEVAQSYPILQPHGPKPSPSVEFSRQGYWSGLPFPSPGDLPNPGIEPGFPGLQLDDITV